MKYTLLQSSNSFLGRVASFFLIPEYIYNAHTLPSVSCVSKSTTHLRVNKCFLPLETPDGHNLHHVMYCHPKRPFFFPISNLRSAHVIYIYLYVNMIDRLGPKLSISFQRLSSPSRLPCLAKETVVFFRAVIQLTWST